MESLICIEEFSVSTLYVTYCNADFYLEDVGTLHGRKFYKSIHFGVCFLW